MKRRSFLIGITFFSFLLLKGKKFLSELPQHDFSNWNENPDSNSKIASLFIPTNKTVQDFENELNEWVDMKVYNRIKYAFIETGRITSTESIKNQNPIVYKYTFKTNKDLLEFENLLSKHDVFKSEVRKKLGYRSHEVYFQSSTLPEMTNA